jgi:DNA-binding protein H-NS
MMHVSLTNAGNIVPRAANLSRIEARIRELQAQAEALRNPTKPGIKELMALVKKYELDMSDIKKALKERGAAGKIVTQRKTLLPKYRNPADKTKTWSGKGRKPRWFVTAVRAGVKLRELKV